MSHDIISRSARALLSALALGGCACNGQAAATDPPVGAVGAGGTSTEPVHAEIGPLPIGPPAPPPPEQVDESPPAAECADGVQNGSEAGVDCGGPSCALCPPPADPCGCASSGALRPLACDESDLALRGVSAPLLSGDGLTVAYSLCRQGGACQPFRWTEAGGAVALPVTGDDLIMRGIGADGTLLLGHGDDPAAEAVSYDPSGAATSTGLREATSLLAENGVAFGIGVAGPDNVLSRWTRGGGLEAIVTLPEGATSLELVAATPDASVLVGNLQNAGHAEAFRWSREQGLLLGIEGVPSAADGARVTALSRDGLAVTGITFAGEERLSVFRSSESAGLTELGPAVRNNDPGSQPLRTALSDDGSVAVFGLAVAQSEGYYGTFRWAQANEVAPLAPGVQSTPSLMSGDGTRVIAGMANGQLVWSAASGARDLRSVLEGAGVDLDGWALGFASVLSRDGKQMVGLATCGETPTPYRMLLPD
jgi:hypothetical protein